MNVLIAEDNHLNQQLMALFMKRFGWRYTIVSDGFGAVDACKAGTFDIVLMDVDMPGMDGIEATRIIRERWPHGPKIIVVTSFEADMCRDLCYDAGADDFLNKPVRVDELGAAIERNLSITHPTMAHREPSNTMDASLQAFSKSPA